MSILTANVVSDELLLAAQRYGPESKEPPGVRAPFPLVALPRVMREFVQDAAQGLGVDAACVATHAIATCATAIGNTCRIKLRRRWSEPSVIWAVTLMESGQLKTPAYKEAFEPLRVCQKLADEKYEVAQASYKQEKAEFELNTDLGKGQQGYQEAPREPPEPKPVEYYTSDSTVEALGILFANNPRGLAFTRDELSGFFGSFGAYKGGRGGDEAAYLEFYNAGSLKLNRASGKRISVHHAALSIFGTCQPGVFLKSIGAQGRGANQVENGMAARFILAAPEPRAMEWHEDPGDFDIKPYYKMIADLVDIPLPTDPDGRVKPTLISMDQAATRRFKAFVPEHGKQTAAITNDALRYHYVKLAAVAARIALIFYLCEGVTGDLTGPALIQDRHILSGIALARWYGQEARRVYHGYESPGARDEREILDMVYACGGSITPREMCRGSRRWPDTQAAERALQDLERAGHGTLVVETGAKGGRPGMRFRLHADKRQTPENPGIPAGLSERQEGLPDAYEALPERHEGLPDAYEVARQAANMQEAEMLEAKRQWDLPVGE